MRYSLKCNINLCREQILQLALLSFSRDPFVHRLRAVEDRAEKKKIGRSRMRG